MKTYIKSTSSISPQPTFDQSEYLTAWENHEGAYLKAVEPSYKGIIDSKMSRRMSRIIKMSVATAKQALHDAQLDTPDAIIVGTGLGCIDDTQKFLKSIVDNEEGILSPTAFIQSTHNTIAGQIALLLQCPNYNFTYTNRGHSFENALIDARILLNDGMNAILVGAAEETTETSHEILQKVGCAGDGKSALPLGEGASFFVLTNEAAESRPFIQAVATYNNISTEECVEAFGSFLRKQELTRKDIDAVVMGRSEKLTNDYCQAIESNLHEETTVVGFKTVSGEHFTASGFGLHLAVHMLEKQRLFPGTIVAAKKEKNLKNILIYNCYQEANHTFMLLSI